MKVIGECSNGYIVEVSHTELEKVTDKYYGHLPHLRVGGELDLGQGYDFRYDIRQACKSMVEAMERFGRVQDSLFNFAKVVGHIPETKAEVQS